MDSPSRDPEKKNPKRRRKSWIGGGADQDQTYQDRLLIVSMIAMDLAGGLGLV